MCKKELEELKKEVDGDVEIIIEKNRKFFDQKFEAIEFKLKEDIDGTVRRQGDRVVADIKKELHAVGRLSQIIDKVSCPLVYNGLDNHISCRTSTISGTAW